MGNNFTPDVIGATLDLYAEDLVFDPSIECLADLAYGDEERQVLDLYRHPHDRGGPLMLFVPGGGFDGGDKRINDLFFGNIARWFASKGVIGAVMNYRLAPSACWPAGALDVHRAVEWLRRKAANLGFDPDQIWVVGNSAGANHVATALLDRSLADEPMVRGAALVSGIRAASFTEFGLPSSPPDPRKWEKLHGHLRELGLDLGEPVSRWMGARPTLPDYLPAIGISRRADNVIYAFGHQHLGLTLAATTGEIVSQLATSSAAAIDMQPFDIDRFAFFKPSRNLGQH
ncbi:MAG: hypothetical protein DI547_00020 [Sphingobium sp.]|nr:MAG: hypothetical protein DI547_00020 [Sphingobium sp.]